MNVTAMNRVRDDDCDGMKEEEEEVKIKFQFA